MEAAYWTNDSHRPIMERLIGKNGMVSQKSILSCASGYLWYRRSTVKIPYKIEISSTGPILGINKNKWLEGGTVPTFKITTSLIKKYVF